jgi:hypothetical protein
MAGAARVLASPTEAGLHMVLLGRDSWHLPQQLAQVEEIYFDRRRRATPVSTASTAFL